MEINDQSVPRVSFMSIKSLAVKCMRTRRNVPPEMPEADLPVGVPAKPVILQPSLRNDDMTSFILSGDKCVSVRRRIL